MDFELTAEQKQLQDSARRFVKDQMNFAKWRQMVEAGTAYDAANWSRMADLGWLALAIPEADGGLGGEPFDTMIIMEALGAGLALEPYVSNCVLAPVLLSKAQDEVRQPILEGIASGQIKIALALGDGDGGFDALNIATTAALTGADYVLDGHKTYVSDGRSADFIIIPARLSGAPAGRDGLALFLVAANAAGLSRENFRAPDHRRVSRLTLNDLSVSTAQCLIKGPEAAALLEKAIDHAIVAEIAEALGAMDAVCEQTLLYLKTRQQFGTTIGSFQALQHRMADMAIACEETRSLLYYVTDRLSADDKARRLAVSAAKARVGQCALFVGHQAVQLHGGMGASDELPISHYLKRLRMLDMRFGNADHHLAVYASLKQR